MPYYSRPATQILLPRLTPAVKSIIIANVAVFIWQILASLMSPQGAGFITQFLGLTPALFFGNLFLWQAATYLFLHSGFWHLFFNMFALWMFGSDLERYWGRRAFLIYYFVTGVGAGLFSALFHPMSPIPTIGASGAVYGILMAFGMAFPNRIVYIYFILPLKVKYFVAFFGVLAFLSALSSGNTAVDNFAHLGGMIVGFLYLKGWLTPSDIRQAYYRYRLKQMRKRFKVYEGQDRSDRRRDDDYWIN